MLTKAVNIAVAAKTLMLGADLIRTDAGKSAWVIINYTLILEGTGSITFWSAITDTVTDATTALSGVMNPGAVPLYGHGTEANPAIVVPAGQSFWIELAGGTAIRGHFSYRKLAGR